MNNKTNNEDAFLNIAKRDIKTANMLFEMQRFPEAIYYLQQANEKIVKSFGLGLNIITEKEIKGGKYGIGHSTYKFLKFFYKYTKEYSGLTYKNENEEEDDNKKIDKYFKEINDKFKNHNTDILKKELEFVLNKDKLNEWLIKQVSDFFNESFLLKISAVILTDILTKQKDIKEYLIPMFKTVYIGIMLSNHNQLSRYPFEKGDKIIEPHTYYNVQNPLVKNYKFIERIIEESILIVKEAINNKHLYEIKGRLK